MSTDGKKPAWSVDIDGLANENYETRARAQRVAEAMGFALSTDHLT